MEQEQNNIAKEQIKKDSGVGPIIGSIIIIIILVIGAFYYLGYLMNKEKTAETPQENTENTANVEISDPEIKQIQEELKNNSDLDSIDQELEQIEQEINSAI